ncbi:unnamed protein product [Phytomonas sp. Hart1]|nr:unnamed protein product [Phytomonas sp. Hart1]|eukprot:CCW68831.1 unnamed protein product [Phytomonas sp. isolate Hart1]
MDNINSKRGFTSDLVVSKQENQHLRTHNEEAEKSHEDKINCLQRENHFLRQHISKIQKEHSEFLIHNTHTSISKDHETALRSKVASLQNMLEREKRHRVARESKLQGVIRQLRLTLDRQLVKVDSVIPQAAPSSPLIRSHSERIQDWSAMVEQSADTPLDDVIGKPFEAKPIRSSLSSLKSIQISSDRASHNHRIVFESFRRGTIDDDNVDSLIPEGGVDTEQDTREDRGIFIDPAEPSEFFNSSIEPSDQAGVRSSGSAKRLGSPSYGVRDAYRVMCWTSNRHDEQQRRLRQLAGSQRDSNLQEQTSETSDVDEAEAPNRMPRSFTSPETNRRFEVPLSPYGARPFISAVNSFTGYSHNQGATPSDPQKNPNQIGIEILDEKNRTWYTKQVLSMALLGAIPPEREDRFGANLDGSTTSIEVRESNLGGLHPPLRRAVRRFNRAAAPGLNPNNNKPSLVKSPETDVSCFLLRSDSPIDSSLSSDGSDAFSSMLKSTMPITKEENVTACQEKKAGTGGGMPMENASGGATGRTTASTKMPLLYKDVNPQAIQRAIEETLFFHFHCADNAPVMTPGMRLPIKKSPLRAFAQDNNTDPNLLDSFSPFHKFSGVENLSDEMNLVAPGTCKYRDDEVYIYYHAPVIFSQIRSFLGLNSSVLRSALKNSTWRQSTSPGKSGTMLFFFGDFVIKTIRKYEFTFFCQRFLPDYVQYCERTPHTLLPRFFALLTMKWPKLGVTQRMILMQNVFKTRYYIHRLYDVKGSTVGRTALQPGKESTRTAYGALLLKDNDLPEQLIICGPHQRDILTSQLRKDVSFLRSLNIVDYSCMIGVRGRFFPKEKSPSKIAMKRCKNPAACVPTTSLTESITTEVQATGDGMNGYGNFPLELSSGARFYNHQREMMNGVKVSYVDNSLSVCPHGCDGGLLSLPICVPGDDALMREEVYYIGLIDVLQEYNSTKMLENFAKGFVNDRTQLSAVPPKEYAERLCRVIERITV